MRRNESLFEAAKAAGITMQEWLMNWVFLVKHTKKLRRKSAIATVLCKLDVSALF